MLQSHTGVYLLVVQLLAQVFIVLFHISTVFALVELQSGDGTGAFSVEDAPHLPPLLHPKTETRSSENKPVGLILKCL